MITTLKTLYQENAREANLFLVIYFVPAGTKRFDNAVLEAVYISQGPVMRHLGPQASKPVALGVASLSGTLLAVCSCTVLPLFDGIYKRGAGLGAAIALALLLAGPARCW